MWFLRDQELPTLWSLIILEGKSCKLLDQAIPEVIPAFWSIWLSRVGEFVFLSLYNKKVLMLEWGNKENTSVWEMESSAPPFFCVAWPYTLIFQSGLLTLSHSPTPSSPSNFLGFLPSLGLNPSSLQPCSVFALPISNPRPMEHSSQLFSHHEKYRN